MELTNSPSIWQNNARVSRAAALKFYDCFIRRGSSFNPRIKHLVIPRAGLTVREQPRAEKQPRFLSPANYQKNAIPNFRPLLSREIRPGAMYFAGLTLASDNALGSPH